MSNSIKSNQSGIAHLMLIIVVVVIAGIAGAGYYVYSNQDSDSSSSSEAAKVLEAECKKEIDDKDFCKFASNINFDEDYVGTFTTTSAEGTNVMVFESSGTDSKVTSSLNGNEVSAFISIGNATYTKNIADGNWTKYVSETTSTDTIAEDTEFELDDSIVEDSTKYEKIGKEACGDLTCFKYKIVDSTDTTSEMYVWFDDDEYKLRKMTSTSAEGTTEITYVYKNVDITEPSPIVEAPDYENMSEAELQQALEAAMQQYGDE